MSNWLTEHKFEVLAVTSCIGTATTAVMAVVKAEDIAAAKAEAKAAMANETGIKKVWVGTKKMFVPTLSITIPALAGIGATIATGVVRKKEIAGFTAALALEASRSRDLLEYKKKAEAVMSSEQASKVREELAKEKEERGENVYRECPEAGFGQLFFDCLSERYFFSDLDTINAGVRRIERRIHDDPFNAFIPANDLYYEWGIGYNTEIGKMAGFSCYWNNGELDLDTMGTRKSPLGILATEISFNWVAAHEAACLKKGWK